MTTTTKEALEPQDMTDDELKAAISFHEAEAHKFKCEAAKIWRLRVRMDGGIAIDKQMLADLHARRAAHVSAEVAPVVDRALYSELIHIAAELARGNGFLSTCAEDMNPRLKRAGILKTAERQEERLKDWAYRVRRVADNLAPAAPASTVAPQQSHLTLHYFTPSEKPDCCFICEHGALEHPETPKHNVPASPAALRCANCGHESLFSDEGTTTCKKPIRTEAAKDKSTTETHAADFTACGCKCVFSPAALGDEAELVDEVQHPQNQISEVRE